MTWKSKLVEAIQGLSQGVQIDLPSGKLDFESTDKNLMNNFQQQIKKVINRKLMPHGERFNLNGHSFHGKGDNKTYLIVRIKCVRSGHPKLVSLRKRAGHSKTCGCKVDFGLRIMQQENGLFSIQVDEIKHEHNHPPLADDELKNHPDSRSNDELQQTTKTKLVEVIQELSQGVQIDLPSGKLDFKSTDKERMNNFHKQIKKVINRKLMPHGERFNLNGAFFSRSYATKGTYAGVRIKCIRSGHNPSKEVALRKRARHSKSCGCKVNFNLRIMQQENGLFRMKVDEKNWNKHEHNHPPLADDELKEPDFKKRPVSRCDDIQKKCIKDILQQASKTNLAGKTKLVEVIKELSKGVQIDLPSGKLDFESTDKELMNNFTKQIKKVINRKLMPHGEHFNLNGIDRKDRKKLKKQRQATFHGKGNNKNYATKSTYLVVRIKCIRGGGNKSKEVTLRKRARDSSPKCGCKVNFSLHIMQLENGLFSIKIDESSTKNDYEVIHNHPPLADDELKNRPDNRWEDIHKKCPKDVLQAMIKAFTISNASPMKVRDIFEVLHGVTIDMKDLRNEMSKCRRELKDSGVFELIGRDLKERPAKYDPKKTTSKQE